jgi:hypothetical protein
MITFVSLRNEKRKNENLVLVLVLVLVLARAHAREKKRAEEETEAEKETTKPTDTAHPDVVQEAKAEVEVQSETTTEDPLAKEVEATSAVTHRRETTIDIIIEKTKNDRARIDGDTDLALALETVARKMIEDDEIDIVRVLSVELQKVVQQSSSVA